MILKILRKMIRSKGLSISLLTGYVLAVAMLTAIPMYTAGIMQRMLIKDLESYQVGSGYFPGRFLISANLYTNYHTEDRYEAFSFFNRRIMGTVGKLSDLPVLTSSRVISMDYFHVYTDEPDSLRRRMSVEAVYNLHDHVSILHGRMFSSERTSENLYEVMVTEMAMHNLDLTLNGVYNVTDFDNRIQNSFKVKVVGVFSIKDPVDPFWFQQVRSFGKQDFVLRAYDASFMMDYSLLTKEFVRPDIPLLTRAQWYYALDFRQIRGLTDIERIMEAYQHYSIALNFQGVEIDLPFIAILEMFIERERQLRTTLLLYQIPVFIMLFFYMFMVSQLIIESDKNEIAVLKSRGASKRQVLTIYFIQSLILCIISTILGPLLGRIISTILGASDGFMEFVGRRALVIELDSEIYLYLAAAAGVSMLATLLPAYLSSRISIVQYKQSIARTQRHPFWQRFYLDILMLISTGYGIYQFSTQYELFQMNNAADGILSINPLLFLNSTLFILGCGLLFIRLYPWVVMLIFQTGKRFWSPVFYVSFIQITRSKGEGKYLMMFLIFALAIGIFNANTARTINRNVYEQVLHRTGTDIVVKPLWVGRGSRDGTGIEPGGAANGAESRESIFFGFEPQITPFKEIPGITSISKVLRKSDAVVNTPAGQRIDGVNVMAIEPHNFGTTAWVRHDLLYHPLEQYLNIMVQYPRSVLVSQSLKNRYNLNEGDILHIQLGENEPIEVSVMSFVSYWPTYDPHQNGGLIVANLQYIFDNITLEPYEIWMNKDAGVSSKSVRNHFVDKRLAVTEYIDSESIIIENKNEPMLQGMNGSLTLVFLISMLISIIGFLIYWIISIKSRTLRFGIFRAIGFSTKNIIGMLACEQLLLSVVSILIGIIIGGLTSDIFIPLIQLSQDISEQVLPFNIHASRIDFFRIYGIVGFMLILGLAVLGIAVKRINITQALKLGEE